MSQIQHLLARLIAAALIVMAGMAGLLRILDDSSLSLLASFPLSNSCCLQHSPPQQVKVCSPKHLAFDQLEPGNLTFHLSLTPGG